MVTKKTGQPDPPTRLSPRDAVGAALHFYQEVTSTQAKGRLEEVKLSDDEKYWLITLSFLQPADSDAWAVVAAVAPRSERAYKTFRVEATSGRVVAMEMLESQ
jgi:hypothetical protein